MTYDPSAKPGVYCKSLATAILFAVFLGPIGLLYATVFGGAIMIFLTYAALNSKFYSAALIFYLVSCIWAAYATNRYNRGLAAILR